jgi:integrase
MVEADKARGEFTDPHLGRTTFDDWAAEVMASRVNLAPATKVRDDAVLRRLVLPHLGDSKLVRVKPVDVQRWIGTLSAAGYAPSTIRKAYELAASVFEAAVLSDMLGKTPCRGIRLPKLEQRSMRFLSVDEVQHLADTIDLRFRVLVLTAAGTGLRWGELAGLRLENLDLLRRSLRVAETLTEVQGTLTTAPPKTASSRRTVALPGFLVDVLARHLAQHPTDSYVFRSPNGSPLRRSHFRTRFWLPAVRGSVGESCRFHDLRHSHAAMLIAEGVHPKVIQERLGHASIRTTLDVYGHLFEGLDEAAADVLDAAFSRPHVDEMWTNNTERVVELHRQT